MPVSKYWETAWDLMIIVESPSPYTNMIHWAHQRCRILPSLELHLRSLSEYPKSLLLSNFWGITDDQPISIIDSPIIFCITQHTFVSNETAVCNSFNLFTHVHTVTMCCKIRTIALMIPVNFTELRPCVGHKVRIRWWSHYIVLHVWSTTVTTVIPFLPPHENVFYTQTKMSLLQVPNQHSCGARRGRYTHWSYSQCRATYLHHSNQGFHPYHRGSLPATSTTANFRAGVIYLQCLSPACPKEDKERSQSFHCGEYLPFMFLLHCCERLHLQNYLEQWAKHEEEFANKLMRHEGLGSHPALPSCETCNANSAPYRCLDCYFRSFSCKECIIHQHLNHPLHMIQV